MAHDNTADVFALEEPLAHAMGLTAALRLVGYGMRMQGSDEGNAILALSESLEQDHEAILHRWEDLHLATLSHAKRPHRG
jgi:hypothetical protein